MCDCVQGRLLCTPKRAAAGDLKQVAVAVAAAPIHPPTHPPSTVMPHCPSTHSTLSHRLLLRREGREGKGGQVVLGGSEWRSVSAPHLVLLQQQTTNRQQRHPCRQHTARLLTSLWGAHPMCPRSLALNPSQRGRTQEACPAVRHSAARQHFSCWGPSMLGIPPAAGPASQPHCPRTCGLSQWQHSKEPLTKNSSPQAGGHCCMSAFAMSAMPRLHMSSTSCRQAGGWAGEQQWQGACRWVAEFFLTHHGAAHSHTGAQVLPDQA